MRLRGTAQQLFEKYLQLGRDATGSGDRVMAESYFQHAEHYFRILNAMNQVQQGQPPYPPRRFPSNEPGEGGEASGDQPELSAQANGHAIEIVEAEPPEMAPPEGQDQG